MAKRTLDINIMIFVLNLIIPAYPLDAARMVAAMCVHCGMTIEKAGYVLVVIGAVLGFVCLMLGIFSLINGGGYGLFYLLIGVFVLWTSWSLYSMIKNGSIGTHPIFQPDCYHNDNGAPRARVSTRPRPNNNTRDIETGNSKNNNKKPQNKNGKNPPIKNGKAPPKKTPAATSNGNKAKGGGPPKKNQNAPKKQPAKKPNNFKKVQAKK